ncbi:uncharacterized protein LOC134179043 [Corticium candelabrum]|uniref:uncharacterized protein LOC134179043 n=1 Tax=Corticium candelabrum TaxID=121492 RepID=UPI002E26CDC3|nr:uncharacterized protein LOC134179043 [Corticium candelabrum]
MSHGSRSRHLEIVESPGKRTKVGARAFSSSGEEKSPDECPHQDCNGSAAHDEGSAGCLDREKRAAVKDQRQRADVAECEWKNEKVLRKGVELTNFTMRLELLQQGEINDSLPSWTQWNVHLPEDSWTYNRMGDIEGRLVVGGLYVNLHVLSAKRDDKWDTFVSSRM